jgi:hypothetical protein
MSGGDAEMPRRAATIEREIPLYLVAHIVQREVRSNGEALERVIVRKTHSHFYTISLRTRPVKRELKGKPATRRRFPVEELPGGETV